MLLGVRGASLWSMRTAPSGDDLYGVSCASARKCVVTGANGTVASTATAGRKWHLQGTATTDVLRGVVCPQEALCYAAGDYGALLKITPR